MPTNTPPSGSNRMPPATPPISIPASASKKRQRELPSIEDSLGSSINQNDVDENGDVDMHLPPSRTPAISPDLLHGRDIPTINPLVGQQELSRSQTGRFIESKLMEGLVTGKKEASDEIDHSGPSAKRNCVGEEASSSMMDISNIISSAAPRNSSLESPRIDEYAQALGVGWTKMGDDPDVLAACRGYSRYIENHYLLTNVEVLVRSKSLDSFLVRTARGYYLFNEELTEGRLVAKEFDVTLEKLKSPTIQFDGVPIYTSAAPEASPSKDDEMEASDMEMSEVRMAGP